MLKPSKIAQAQAFIRFFQANFWYKVILLVEETLVSDGFYDEMKRLSIDMKWNIQSQVMSSQISKWDLYITTTTLLGNEPKIAVIHANLPLTKRIFNIVREANMSDINHAWFLTENSYIRDHDELEVFPAGTLSIVAKYVAHTDDIVVDATNMLTKAVSRMYAADRRIVRRRCKAGSQDTYTAVGDDMYRHLLDTELSGISGDVIFTGKGKHTYNFVVQYLVREESQVFWRKIGHVRGDDVSPFGIIWPGESISSNIIKGKKTYRIVTNPVKPFVMEQAPHEDVGDCVKDRTCIYIPNEGKIATIQAIQDFENGVLNQSNPYEIRCCRGLSVDLLNRLSQDLDFEYYLYIVSDTTYGKEINGTWNGMVRDLMTGTAHMSVAAMSITRSRMKVIDFTSPYFFSGFSVLYTERQRATNMQAFLEPFDIRVWFAILIFATLTTIAMGIFEWNSPFGLNPWGKKRKQNYTLGSSMTMVYSVLFGHTVKTKSPKAWPSKVMQNMWAASCIFIIASYTANLAAFIAGKHAGISYAGIHDSRLLDIRVGVLPGSAVEGFIKKIASRLYKVSQKRLADSTDKAIDQLMDGDLDAYLGDYPILDYARSKLDPDCDLRILSQPFGEDGYGIGLPKGSPLKPPISKKIQDYHQSGYIEDLIDVHFADSQCYKQRITQEDSRLEVLHHAGSFALLCVGIILGVMLLLFEHGIFRWLVPKFRKMPGHSMWKSVHVMFFSQRLHRTITSAELVSANETCREMLGMMKNREFMRLFQKQTIRVAKGFTYNMVYYDRISVEEAVVFLNCAISGDANVDKCEKTRRNVLSICQTNKLADAAKRKRLNRNFFDIVEKAKWMQEMRDNNLFGDDSSPNSPAPEITEISLKDIGRDVDLKSFHRQQQVNAGSHRSSLEPETTVDNDNNWLVAPSDHPPVDWTLSGPETDVASPPANESSADTFFSGSLLEYHDSSTCDSGSSADAHHYNYASPVFDIETGFDTIEESNESPHVEIPDDNVRCRQVIEKETPIHSAPKLPNGNPFAHEYRPLRHEHSSRKSSSVLLERHSSLPVSRSRDIPGHSGRKRRSMRHVRGSAPDERTFNADKYSKDELLCMWKSSDLELNRRLEDAITDKEILERKLESMKRHVSTPV